MVLTVVFVLLIALFSYVNLTVGRNFDFKPDLTLILATPHPYITLESVRLLEKTLQMLGIEPGSYCLAARNFIMVLTVESVLLIALLSYVNLTTGRNFNFKPDLTLIQATPHPYITLESVRLFQKAEHLLGIEPGHHCLATRIFTTLPNCPYDSFCTFNRTF